VKETKTKHGQHSHIRVQ